MANIKKLIPSFKNPTKTDVEPIQRGRSQAQIDSGRDAEDWSPFDAYYIGPDAEIVTDGVKFETLSAEQVDARAGHISDAQKAGFAVAIELDQRRAKARAEAREAAE